MRKFILLSAFLLASASAQAQSIDIGSITPANGISTTSGIEQSQFGSAQAGAGSQASKGRSAKSAKKSRTATRESADETKARRIAAKYGVSW